MSFPRDTRCWSIKRNEELSKSWFHKLPVVRRYDLDPVQSSLCSGCDSLDLPGIVARMRADPQMKTVALPPWTNSAEISMNDGACALCAMFSANWDPNGTIGIEWMESLYFGRIEKFSSWSPAAVVFYTPGGNKKAVFEMITTQGNHLDPMSRLVDPNSIDFDRIRLWLQSCSNAELAVQPRQKTSYLPGFRLIHCKSREITSPSQECRYVALSYVWGKPLPEESQSQCFPHTIEDAIRVCLKLGFEYIWIDRYCIDQGNNEDKHAQISQMDVIYSEASLVIIAAAGDDPTYGLPGIGAQACTPQQSIKLKDCTLLQTFLEVYNDFKESAWIKRGWTLQEGYFGTRKLIFTNYQVTYVCKHDTCNESVLPPISWDESMLDWRLGDEHEWSYQRSRWRLKSYFSFEHDLSGKTTDSTWSTRCGLIEEFTRRNLSYDSDVYNALHGIFNSWSKAEPSNMIGQICGIPVENYGLQLNWKVHHDQPTPRREEFPTWSWLCRKGPISFGENKPLGSISVQKCGDVELKAVSGRAAELSEESWISIAEYSHQAAARTPRFGTDEGPRLLRITAWCPRICMTRQTVDPSQYVKPSECMIKKSHGRLRFDSEYGDIKLDRQDLTQTEWESCIAVLIGSTEDSHAGPWTIQTNGDLFSFLLLCPTSDSNIYERVGIFEVELERDMFHSIPRQSDDGTPDWHEDPCDYHEDPRDYHEDPRDYHEDPRNYRYTIGKLDSIDDLPIVGLTMTHDMRQGLCRTQEDEPHDYDLAKDFNRFMEEPDENFEDSFVFSSDFPDWETRVFIVR